MFEVKQKKENIIYTIIWDSMTWPAVFLSSTCSAILGLIFAYEKVGSFPTHQALLLVLIASFMNASVNSLNDYYDYIQGNDTKENVVSNADAPLAFHQVSNPNPVLYAGLLLLAFAGVMGIIIVWECGYKPLFIGVIGVISVLTYSGNVLKTSHMPIGEVLSGFVLGGLIPLGVYTALTKDIDITLLWKSIPMMMIVAQFMLINNTSDLERDQASGRKTFPIIVGRKNAIKVAKILYIFWMLQMACCSIMQYPLGTPVIILTVIICIYGIKKGWNCPRIMETKNKDTLYATIVALAVAIGYPLAIVTHLMISKI